MVILIIGLFYWYLPQGQRLLSISPQSCDIIPLAFHTRKVLGASEWWLAEMSQDISFLLSQCPHHQPGAHLLYSFYEAVKSEFSVN